MTKQMASHVLGTTRLKRAGGSLMTTIPSAARNMLHLTEGQEMTVSVEGARVVLEPVAASAKRVRVPRYTLDELVSQCEAEPMVSDETRVWQDAPAEGREVW